MQLAIGSNLPEWKLTRQAGYLDLSRAVSGLDKERPYAIPLVRPLAPTFTTGGRWKCV